MMASKPQCDYVVLFTFKTDRVSLRIGVTPDGTVEKPDGMTEAQAISCVALGFLQFAPGDVTEHNAVFEMLKPWGISFSEFLKVIYPRIVSGDDHGS